MQEPKVYNRRGLLKLKPRVKQPDKWLRNIAKLKRNNGEEYIGHGGVVRPARSVQPPCDETCTLKCTTRITEERRKEIFAKYWGLGDLTLQRRFIINCLERVEPKQRRKHVGSKRSQNCAYNFFDDYQHRTGPTRVCKTFFLRTLDIGKKVVLVAIKKFNAETGTLEADKRGGNW